MTRGGALKVGANGMTLHTFDKDDMAGSGRIGLQRRLCRQLATAHRHGGARRRGHHNLVTRDDGTKQVAYKASRCTTEQSDMKPGDKTGDGIGTASGAPPHRKRPRNRPGRGATA